LQKMMGGVGKSRKMSDQKVTPGGYPRDGK